MRTNDVLVAIRHSTSNISSTFVTSLIATKYEKCRTSMQRKRTSANVEGSLQRHYFNYELWGEPMPYTAIVNFTKLQLDVVTMKSDLHHLKLGCISNISILKVVCSFDLSSLLELQMHSVSRSPAALSRKKTTCNRDERGRNQAIV